MPIKDVINACKIPGNGLVLAPGTYVLEDEPLHIAPGMRLTIPERATFVGTGNREGDYDIRLLGEDISVVGDLTFINPNSGGLLGGNWTGVGSNDGCKIEGARIDLGKGYPLRLESSRDVTLKNCQVSIDSLGRGPLDFGGMAQATIAESSFKWTSGRLAFNFWTESIINGNSFLINYADRTSDRTETGGVELSYANELLFADNRIECIGGVPLGGNDGELIMAQKSNVPDFGGSGKVVSCKGEILETTIRWKNAPWLALGYPITRRMVVMVLSGVGAGQYRDAQPGNVDGTILLDRPFDVVPGRNAVVALSSLSAHKLSILRNDIIGGLRGIMLVESMVGLTVEHNRIRNSGGISVYASSKEGSFGFQHCPVWDASIRFNDIEDKEGRAASITAHVADVRGSRLPMALKNVDLRPNLYDGQGNVNPTDPFALKDGLTVTNVDETGGSPLSSRMASVLTK